MKRLENINVLSKYQLVFVKLETGLSKLVHIIKMRNLLQTQKMLEKYRQNVKSGIFEEKKRASQLIEKMHQTILNLQKIYKRKSKSLMSKSVFRWKCNSKQAKFIKLFEKESKDREDKYKKEISQKTLSIAGLEEKLLKNNSEVEQLKKNEKSLKQVIKEKEEKEKILRNGIEKAKKSDQDDKKLPKNVEDRLQALENHIANLEAENRELKDKLESTEGNVGSFIQEMTDLLEAKEFSSKSSVF